MEIVYNALEILISDAGDIESRLLKARTELREHGNEQAIPADFRELYNTILEELGEVEKMKDSARAELAKRIFALWSEVELSSF